MHLDIRTLLVALALNCGLAGLVFLYNWTRSSQGAATLYSGVAALVASAGIVLLVLRGMIPDRVSIDLANGFVVLGIGLGWAAIRQFSGRPAPLPLAFAGLPVWLGACLIPVFYENTGYRIALISAIASAYSLGAAYELRRAQPTGGSSGRALAALCLFHGVFVAARAVQALLGGVSESYLDNSPMHLLFTAEPALAIFGMALLGVGMLRERHETELKRTADTDSLTGVLNRRGFLEGAARQIARARETGRPVGLLLFDLDHFKAVNDRYGHLAGDRALIAFAGLVARAIRANDLIGRIGGEEFAALLEGVDTTTATVIAERIRSDFASLEIDHDNVTIAATVSAGVAVMKGPASHINVLLADADRALYDAKRSGRDRVRSALAIAS